MFSANITKKTMIKLEIEIIGYRIIIRHIANMQSVINVTRTDLLYGVLSLSIIFGGKMDNKFKRIIEYKKQKGSVRKPKYATRKLSIGLVSCMLGYALLVSPSSVEAAELDSENQAVAEETAETETTSEENPVEENKETETPAEETPAEELKEESPEETPDKEAPAEGTTTENKEAAVVEKEVFTLTEEQRQNLKEAGFTDSEITEIEEEITGELEADPKFDTDSFLKEITEQKAAEAEMGEAKSEPVAAGEETQAGRDISNDITEVEVHVGETQTPGVLNAGDGEGLAWSVAFKAPDDTKPGDYFDITLSDNWTLKGIEPDTEIADPINIDGKTVDDGKRLSRQKIRYTFNENIKHVDDIRVYVQYGGYDVKEKVQDSKTQTFTISVGNYSDSKDLFVDYGNVSYDDYQRVLNGTSQYTHFDPDTGDFTQVFYINPESRYIGHSTGVNFNGSVGVILDGRGFDGTQSDVYFTPENTKVEIVKLAPRTKLPGAVYENPVAGEIYQSVNPLIQDGKISIDFNRNGIDNPYIITVKSKIDPNVKYINLGSRATLYGNGTLDLGLVNQIQFETGNTGGSGEEEDTYSLGDRVWLDKNKDGIQTEGEKGLAGVTVKLTGEGIEEQTTTTDENGNYKFEGLKNGEYKVTFELPKGYKVTDTNIGDDDEKDSDGLEVEATIKDADNKSVDLGLIEETYTLGDKVWIDEDKDGIQGEKETGKSGVTVKLTGGDLTEEKTTTTDENGNYKFEGLKNGDYKVEFVIPEDYEATKSDQGGDDTKDSDGVSVNVTIKDANNDTIDLGLIKKEAPTPEEKTYSLGDKVWIDEDKDGIQGEKETGKSGVTVKLTGGDLTEEKTTTTDENGNYKFEGLKNGEYKVTFVLPEGYEVTKTDEGTDDEKDSDGKEVTVTIKDADDMSIDLGLIKVTETPWTPLEPSEPVEPENPGETPDIPWTPLEPSEPIEPGTPGETPDIPWTPLEPSEPVEPEKPETPDKPEKPGKPETPKDNKDNKVQVPVVESKKEAKKETPTRKKGNPKTGVGSISGAALGLIAAASGLFVSKKNKDEE